MTLRGLAALGVLIVAGCKQPIINVYPAACATPSGDIIGGSVDKGVVPYPSFTANGGGGGGLPSVITSTPVATPTPEVVAECPDTMTVENGWHIMPLNYDATNMESCIYTDALGYYVRVPRGKQ